MDSSGSYKIEVLQAIVYCGNCRPSLMPQDPYHQEWPILKIVAQHLEYAGEEPRGRIRMLQSQWGGGAVPSSNDMR